MAANGSAPALPQNSGRGDEPGLSGGGLQFPGVVHGHRTGFPQTRKFREYLVILHGRHIVDGALLLPGWAAWQLEQRLDLGRLRNRIYAEANVELYELLVDLRTVALLGEQELRDKSEPSRFEPGTKLAASRNLSETSAMTVIDVSVALEITPRAVRKAANDRRIAGVKQGRRGDWLFSREAVEEFAAARAR